MYVAKKAAIRYRQCEKRKTEGRKTGTARDQEGKELVQLSPDVLEKQGEPSELTEVPSRNKYKHSADHGIGVLRVLSIGQSLG